MSINDPTEQVRKEMVVELNKVEGSREYLEDRYGKVWATNELTEDFEVVGFMAPFVVVKSKLTGSKGTMKFQGRPRYYFSFVKD